MKTFVKIDRLTGEILRRKTAPELNRALNKPTVWLELDRKPEPTFNSETETLELIVEQPDLSDLTKSVHYRVKRVERKIVRSLTPEEIQSRNNLKIKTDEDPKLIRVLEDLMVAIAEGKPLIRETFPQAVWDKINKRRRLRGLEDV